MVVYKFKNCEESSNEFFNIKIRLISFLSSPNEQAHVTLKSEPCNVRVRKERGCGSGERQKQTDSGSTVDLTKTFIELGVEL